MSEETGQELSAAIDRFEGEWAVLTFDDGTHLDAPRSALPEGAVEGSWLRVRIIDGQVVSARLDPATRDSTAARIADKLARLRAGKHRTEHQEPS